MTPLRSTAIRIGICWLGLLALLGVQLGVPMLAHGRAALLVLLLAMVVKQRWILLRWM